MKPSPERSDGRAILRGVAGCILGLLSLLASPASASPTPDAPCVQVCSVSHGGGSFDFALARYHADGSRDTSFATGGIVTTSFDAGSAFNYQAVVRSVVIQSDGKIVVAGDAHGASSDDFAVARYGADGSPDISFGRGGQVITTLGHHHKATAQDAVSQPDGDIVVAGSSSSDFVLVRYRPDGSLDTSFGQAGSVTTDFGGKEAAEALALQPDGGIIAAERSGSSTALARYGPDGSLDGSFGSGGRIVFHDRSPVTGVLVQPNGMILAVERPSLRGDLGFRLSRFTSNGSLDRRFGRHGTAGAQVGRGVRAKAATLGPDGKVVVAGEAYSGRRHKRDLTLVRFNSDGTLDRSFGYDGKVVTHRPGSDRAEAVLVRRDGTITVAAVGRTPGSRLAQIAVSHYNTDGSLDGWFDLRGQRISNGRQAPAPALELDGSGIVVARSAPASNSLSQGELAGARPDRGGPAPVRQRVAKTGRKGGKGHRRRPPRPVPAWYINAHNFEELKRFAASDACAFARKQPRGARRTLILDFGGARAYRNRRYGAAVNRESFRATNAQIRIALKVAADAYASCHRRGRVRIAYATTNHFESKRSAHRARRIGAQQARTMRGVQTYQRHHGYSPVEHAGVAGDIEMGWWGPEQSTALVNGAKSVWRHGYIDFGTAGGCPPRPQGVHERGCFNGWTVSDVAFVSHARGGHPVPQVYFRGGPHHFDQAAQWANVAKGWNARHKHGYRFSGATGSAEFGNLSPRSSWRRLRAKAPGRVRREVLNFKQDRLRRGPGGRGHSGHASKP